MSLYRLHSLSCSAGIGIISYAAFPQDAALCIELRRSVGPSVDSCVSRTGVLLENAAFVLAQVQGHQAFNNNSLQLKIIIK